MCIEDDSRGELWTAPRDGSASRSVDASDGQTKAPYTVTEKLIHQGMDRAADQQIDMTSVLLEVPDAPHVRKDALIDTEKVLKLIDDKREGALMGKAHEIIEDVSKLRSCA